MSALFVKAVMDAVDNVLAGKAFPTICTIDKFFPETQRANVCHTVRGVLNDGSAKDLGDIPQVPIHFYGQGRYATGSAPVKGQSVFCIVAGRSIESFKKNGKLADQKDGRVLDWNDAVGFVFDFSELEIAAISNFDDSFWWGVRDGSAGIRLTKDDKISIGTSTADLVALALDLGNKVDELAAIVKNLKTVGTGTATVDPATVTVIETFQEALSSVNSKIDTLKV